MDESYRFYQLVDKSYAFRALEAGDVLFMTDFNEPDQRNMTKRVTSREMLTPERLKSRNVLIYRREPVREIIQRGAR